MPNNILDNINIDNLENLSKEEKEYVLKILDEYSKNGSSDTYSNLLYSDYNEIPVDIETFITDDKYLGQALKKADGTSTLYPYWFKVLKDVFPDPFTINYNTALFTGGIGLGKSTVADIGVAYQLYKLLCLKDPYAYYGLQKIDVITIAFLNNTIDNAKDVAWKKFHEMLLRSPFFLHHGSVNNAKKLPEWEPPNGIDLVAGSSANHILGRCVFAIFIDEINFKTSSMDIEKQKAAALDLVTSASIRMQSRFMKGEKDPTIMFIASSKRDEQSFMETFIRDKIENESKTTLIVDEPQWVIRPDKDSPRKFKVALGNRFLSNELLPLNADEETIKDYINRGYELMDVPMGFYEKFLDDLDKALMEIAGKSTSGIMKYLSGARIAKIKTKAIKNAFTKDIIQVGNGLDDKLQYYDFFDLSRIDKQMMYRPMFIHLDMSVSGDKTGIAGVWIKGKKPHQEGIPDSKELYFQVAFSVSVEAPKGYQVSFEKTRQFIYWLKEQGFNIKGISSDSYMAAPVAQSFISSRLNYEMISVDRVSPESKVCEPYHYFKNALYEERIILYDDCELLTKELLGLERNANGKIDHPDGGKHGSKDQADAIVGSIYNASKHAEEFAYDYGEDYETTFDVNSELNEASQKQQINIDFEEELKRSFMGLNIQNNPNIQKERTYDYTPTIIDSGVLVW